MASNNKLYWKNLKRNWVLLLPSLMGIGLGIMIIVICFNAMTELIEQSTPEQPYLRMFGLTIIVLSVIKLVTWFKFDYLLLDLEKAMNKAMTKK